MFDDNEKVSRCFDQRWDAVEAISWMRACERRKTTNHKIYQGSNSRFYDFHDTRLKL